MTEVSVETCFTDSKVLSLSCIKIINIIHATIQKISNGYQPGKKALFWLLQPEWRTLGSSLSLSVMLVHV